MEHDNPFTKPIPPSQSPSMFCGAAGFGADRSLFANVQGNLNVQPPVLYPTTTNTVLSGLPHAPQMPAPNTISLHDSVYSESATYCSQLLRRGRGFPLYVPGPQVNLPAEYRRRGVAIGDVGRITPEGSFDFFFNIYLPANHPINANIPGDFVPLSPYDPVDVSHYDFIPGNHVASATVTKINSDVPEFPGGEFIFSCREPTGAVLSLPHGAHLEKLENIESVRQYAAKHAESWYKYVNGTRGRGLVNGDLYLVTGCEKAQSWGMACFHEVSLRDEFPLLFRPTTDEANGYRYRWQGTRCCCKHTDSPLDDETPLNQTTFIHAFSISVCEGIWGKFFGVEVCQLVDSATFLDKSGRSFVPYGSQGSSSLWSIFTGGSAYNGGRQATAAGSGHGIVTDAFPTPRIFHPSEIIHERIFREVPQATVVITHDDDWRDVFKDDGVQAEGQTASELQQAIFDRFEIIEEDGAVFLRAKSNSITSRHASTTTVEELPPIYGHNAGDRHDNLHLLSQNGLTDEERNQSVAFNFESTEACDQPVEGAVPDPFAPVGSQSDVPTLPHNPAILSRRFGDQSLGPQLFLSSRPSDNIIFRSQIGVHQDDLDTFAVTDNDSPPSNLTPVAAYPPNDHWIGSYQETDSSGEPPALSPPSPSPTSFDTMNALWSIHDRSNPLRSPALSPLSFNPGLLSPSRAGPWSDVSSIPSLSSSTSFPRFVGSLHSWSYSLDEESSIRGRLVQRGERHNPRNSSSVGSLARVLFEDLSLEDASSADQTISPHRLQNTTESFSAAPPSVAGSSSSPSILKAELPDFGDRAPSLVVAEQNVTTVRMIKASHNQRNQEATFICPVPGCGSTFTRSFNLKRHIRSHNEEKPFLCKWPGCGKGFARLHDCKRHEQLHTNYQPFTCDGCNKQFARMDALNRHLRSEGGAECQRTLEANGRMPDFSGTGAGLMPDAGPVRRARSYSTGSYPGSPDPPPLPALRMPGMTKQEDPWANMNGVAL